MAFTPSWSLLVTQEVSDLPKPLSPTDRSSGIHGVTDVSCPVARPGPGESPSGLG